jgi:quercetin dioxygenase-like cupin family protein
MERDGTAQAKKLADLAAYQKNAIVSREIIGKETGSVTIFAFDAGQALSEHVAPFDAFVYVPEGRVEITIAGTPHLLEQGDAIVMPAHVPHAVKAVQPFKMLLVMIRS